MKQQFYPGLVIRYWHPSKGGWYIAILVRYGHKHAKLRSVVARTVKHKDGSKTWEHKTFTVPVSSIQPATIGDLA